jgi:hypothetical protein
MSYGKEFKVDGQDYLLEIFEKHICVAKKIFLVAIVMRYAFMQSIFHLMRK